MYICDITSWMQHVMVCKSGRMCTCTCTYWCNYKLYSEPVQIKVYVQKYYWFIHIHVIIHLCALFGIYMYMYVVLQMNA